MKRVLLLILSLTILISGINVCATEIAEKDSEIHRNFAILRNLGIADWSEDGSVTRAEFLKVVMDIVLGDGVNAYEKYKSPFSDVDENTKYRTEIVAAHSYGIISGNGETFSPYEEITYPEITKILVGALGYSMQAEARGGYPMGYVAQANLLGIRGYSSDKITKSACAKILLDALDAKVSEVFYNNKGDEVYIDEAGASLLYTTKGIYKIKGIVKNNGLTGLNSAITYGKEYAVIGNSTYINKFSGLSELLGYNVRAYIKENQDGIDIIIHAHEHLNTVLTISDETYIDCVDRVIKYERSSGSVNTIEVPGNAPVIYNNIVTGIYTDADFDIKNGSICFISNDGDSVYDVIKIESYTDYFVLSATSDTFIVTDTYHSKRQLKLEQKDDTEIIILNKNGVELSYEDIGENSVLTVAQSKDGKYAKCYISNDLVSGFVNFIKTSNDVRSIVLDDVEYKVSKSMETTVFNEIMTGSEYTFYLNVNGEIAGYKEDVRTSEFAYVIGAASDGNIDKKAMFKLLLSNGNIVTVNAKNVYYADGTKCEDGVVPAYLKNQQVIRVKMNGKMEITHIDSISGNGNNDFDALENFGPMEDKTYWSRGVCQGGVVVPDNIVIFSVPAITENSKDEKDFEIIAKAQLTAGKHRMQMFNAKKNSYVPQVMVLENVGSPTVSASANTGLVSSLEKTVNSDGELVDRIYMMNQVGEAYYDFKAPDMVSTLGISEGDVIAYELNGKNQITAANIIVDYDKANSRNSILRTDTDVTNLTSPTRSYDATFRVRFGYVYAKEGNVLTISDSLAQNIAKSSVESFIASTSMIYKVEVVRGKVLTSLIKFEDIKDYIHFENNAHMTFAFFQSTAPKMIVVYE